MELARSGRIPVQTTSNLVVIKVKKALEARGSKTIRSLGRTFRLLDSYDRNRKVDKDEFFVGLQENGVKLERSEANVRNLSKKGTNDRFRSQW